MIQIIESFFRSLFSHTEVWICSTVMAFCLVWFLFYVAAKNEQIKICKANLQQINEELEAQPEDANLHVERAFVLTQIGLPMSGVSDLEKAYELGRSADSLKPAFLQCYWNIPTPEVSLITPWSKCEHAAPKLCAELHAENPNSYSPDFLMMPERHGILEQVRKVELRLPKIN